MTLTHDTSILMIHMLFYTVISKAKHKTLTVVHFFSSSEIKKLQCRSFHKLDHTLKYVAVGRKVMAHIVTGGIDIKGFVSF